MQVEGAFQYCNLLHPSSKDSKNPFLLGAQQAHHQWLQTPKPDCSFFLPPLLLQAAPHTSQKPYLIFFCL